MAKERMVHRAVVAVKDWGMRQADFVLDLRGPLVSAWNVAAGDLYLTFESPRAPFTAVVNGQEFESSYIGYFDEYSVACGVVEMPGRLPRADWLSMTGPKTRKED